MKVMVISDIHGSSEALKKAVLAFETEKCDKLLILGDVLYHGPRNDLPEGHNPKECIDILNSLSDKIIGVKGNCDAEVDQMVLNFPIMSDYLFLELGDKTVFATHGQNLESQLESVAKNASVILSGHTHVTTFKKENGKIFANPGSISLPKEETKPGYIILDSAKLFLKINYRITLKTLEGETVESFNF